MDQITVAPMEKTTGGKRRKKLWNISRAYHCSIIGICLCRSELRRLSRKRVFTIEPDSTDYQIHSALVSAAGIKSEKSKTLQRIFEKKFRPAVAQFSKASSDEELKRLWNQYVNDGAIANAYWAIMTHHSASQEFVFSVYGEVHMLGHDFFRNFKRDKQLLTESNNQLELLQQVLVSERLHHLEEKKSIDRERNTLDADRQKALLIAKENTELKNRIAQYQNERKEQHMGTLKQQVEKLQQNNAALNDKLNTVTVELQESRDLLALETYSSKTLEGRNTTLNQEKQELLQEIVSLETTLLFKMTTDAECTTCKDQNTDLCPGPDLCGKTILYVGGQHKMIPRYRQLVEKYGGAFAHHDGGKEASKAVLPKMLTRADAVVCPVDCVSHDACKRVKTICKRYQKPFVMMRSSGLSSLAKGLEGIVQ